MVADNQPQPGQTQAGPVFGKLQPKSIDRYLVLASRYVGYGAFFLMMIGVFWFLNAVVRQF
jgi:hypothetical protein